MSVVLAQVIVNLYCVVNFSGSTDSCPIDFLRRIIWLPHVEKQEVRIESRNGEDI